MSYSSLWGIKSNYRGEQLYEYKNSWLFSPIIFDILPDKYIPEEIETPYGYKKGIIGLGGEEIVKKTNEKVNSCKNMSDRICWELSNQQIFFTKDKNYIADFIKIFVEQNKEYGEFLDGTYPLKQDHIIERFIEIANDIENLDEKKYPYFVLKNTSVDDEVEYWFHNGKSLKDWNKVLREFVVIENGNIINFITNVDFKY